MHAAPTTAFDIPDLVDRLSRLVNNEQLRCENAARRPRALAMLDRPWSFQRRPAVEADAADGSPHADFMHVRETFAMW